jgi:hypothetical protein
VPKNNNSLAKSVFYLHLIHSRKKGTKHKASRKTAAYLLSLKEILCVTGTKDKYNRIQFKKLDG